MINYSALPAIYRHRMQRYIENGVDPGPFLKDVLGGGLYEAVRHAGDFDLQCLGTLVAWLTTEPEIPAGVFGSGARVEEWLKRHRPVVRARTEALRADASEPVPLEPKVDGLVRPGRTPGP